MTREEAIKVIRKMLSYTDLSARANLTADMVDACHMAIKALEQEPTTKNNIGVDCISRKQAIEEADKLTLETGYDNEKVEEMLRDLPSVTPQPYKAESEEEKTNVDTDTEQTTDNKQ